LLGINAAGGEYGSGMIPATALAGLPQPVMIPGGGRCVDSFSVQHYGPDGKPDGISTAMFKSFEQGVEKFQGESVDIIWIDERCSEQLYAECLARTLATNGIIYLSYTPLRGGGPLTYRFLNEPNPDRCDIRIPGSEAVHIDPAKREAVSESLLDYERDARLEGIPQYGIARIFPVNLSNLTKRFTEAELPETAKWSVGLDPGGFTHPAGIVLSAYVPETDQFFVVDSQRLKTGDVHDHARAIAKLSRGLRIPIHWPHDTHKKQATSNGEELAEIYRKREGLPMMPSHVTNPGGSYAVEPAIKDMVLYMNRPGGFTIASHLTELLEEMAEYHLDEKGNVVRLRDDLVSACRYSFMGRYKGKILEMCEHYQLDFGNAGASPLYARPTMADRQRMSGQSRYAKGSVNAPGGGMGWDIFTGKKF
jgi:phage terminase large subunit-like protein